jgi:hypothetical protein
MAKRAANNVAPLTARALRGGVLALSMALAGWHIGAPASALAQAPIEQLAARTDLTDADKAQLKDLIEKNRAGLSGAPTEVRKAREALLQPLEQRSVSVPFRVEYARQLLDVLRPLTKDARDVVAVNALLITGELATSNSSSVLQDGLKDARTSVQLGALHAYARAFLQISRQAPAMSPQEVSRGIEAISALMATSTDARIVDGALSALVSASRTDEGRQALALASASLGARLRAAGKSTPPDQAMVLVGIRGVREMRDALIAAQGQASEQTAKGAGILAGQLLVALREAGRASEPMADLPQAVTLAETTLTLASTNLRGPDIKALNLDLAERARKGENDAFATQLERLIGPGGVLSKAPFNAPADAFKL